MPSRQDVVRRLKLALALAALLLFFGTLVISAAEGVGTGDAFLKTLDVLMLREVSRGGVSGAVQATLLFLGVTLMWLAVWTLMDFWAEGHASYYYRKVKFSMKIGRLKKHVIICGAGRVGSNIAKSLEDSKKFIIIEQDEKAAMKMRDKGYVVMIDDCLDESVLKTAGIEKAAALAAAVGATEKNVYLTLTAKALNPKIKVYARANDEAVAKKLRAVGADYVVMPEVSGAKDIARKILK